MRALKKKTGRNGVPGTDSKIVLLPERKFSTEDH
jgi:hypothetical protein